MAEDKKKTNNESDQRQFYSIKRTVGNQSRRKPMIGYDWFFLKKKKIQKFSRFSYVIKLGIFMRLFRTKFEGNLSSLTTIISSKAV